MTTPRLLSDRYELGDTLGYGGMSEVHRGMDKSTTPARSRASSGRCPTS